MTTATVTGPSFLALQVRDVEAAATFDETQLGLTRAADPRLAQWSSRHHRWPRGPEAAARDGAGRRTTGLGVASRMATGDAQELHDRLASNGVPILTPPFQGPFGLTFVLRDPDGYAITIQDAA